MWACLCSVLIAYVVACAAYHKYARRTGQPIVVSHVMPDGSTIRFSTLSGDLGTPLVVREVLQDEVYFKHGVTLPATGSPAGQAPLVVDVGCNVGLFTLAVFRRHPQAVVVAAEPIPILFDLAVANTAHLAPRVVTVPFGLGRGDAQNVPFVFDPHISAGSSMYDAAIARPFRRRPWHVQLIAVLRDNAEVGNLPVTLTRWLCAGLSRRSIRPIVTLCVLPALVLVFLYLLAGGHHRQVVYGSLTTLRGALDRAADAAADAPSVDARIRGHDPIDLLKLDVEGAEMDVLLGIDEAEWDRIQQVVVEVHDIDDRLSRICDLFREKGFHHIVVDVESWASHELLCIRSVYARR